MKGALNAWLAVTTLAGLLTVDPLHGQPIGIPVEPLGEGPWEIDTAEQHTIQVSVVARGLSHPWAIAFLPDGDMLVTERSGQLRRVHDDTLDPDPITGVPEVRTDGNGGLMDIALHPEFSQNQLVYLTYTKPVENGWGAPALAVGRLEGSALVNVRDLVVTEAYEGNSGLNGRVAFGSDGKIYMSTGGRVGDAAQNPTSLRGKVLRLEDDGSVPADNPFVNSLTHRPEIYTLGHRNTLGLMLHPETGEMWQHENGPNGGDEINILLPGRNYGWPIVSFGRFYSGERVNQHPTREGFESPLLVWLPAIAASGMAVYTGDRFPAWKGNLFVGSLRMGGIAGTGHLQRIVFNERTEEMRRELMLTELRRRIREVREGPDGYLYLLTDEENDGALLRIEPSTEENATRTSALAGSKDEADLIGEVHFDTSCAPEVTVDFNRAVATLHSFEFDEARELFQGIAAADPGCAMAHWGVAMTYYHPLWAPPAPAELSQGAAAVAMARDRAARVTARERGYIEAIGDFFNTRDGATHRERAMRYEEAMAQVAEAHPADREATLFYALARLSNVDPTDKTYLVQQQVGAGLEQLFADMPNHPGLAHYIIHSYDYPDLADRAVYAADRYLEIARALPHALHMSGHIYTLLGMWDRAIHANQLSVDAALNRARMFALGEGTQNELHSLDYLVYAYLQQGENARAQTIVDRVLSFQDLNLNNGVIVFNSSAIPVRHAMERHDWEAAADLPRLKQVEAVGGNDQVMNAIALRYWARAVGAARSGRLAQAEAELIELERIANALADDERVWGRNTSEVFRLQAAAWFALATGAHSRAEQLTRAAAVLEDKTDKSSISPGRVLPAHEQLGDLLMELGRPAEALAAYEVSMSHASGRFNTLLGAARAAEAAGKDSVARSYYRKLLENVSDTADRPEIAMVRAVLN